MATSHLPGFRVHTCSVFAYGPGGVRSVWRVTSGLSAVNGVGDSPRGTLPFVVIIAMMAALLPASALFGASPARADSLMATLDVGTNPTDLAIDATGTFAYAAGCDPDTPGAVQQLVRINLATFTVDDTLPVPSSEACVRAVAVVDDSILFTTDQRLYRVDAQTFGSSLDDSVLIPELGVDIAVHGSRAYITHLAGMDGDKVSKVNISGASLVYEAIFSSGGSWPMGIAIEPSGVHGYVVNAHSDTLAKIRLSDGQLIGTIPTGNQSYGIEIDGTGAYAYIPAAMPDAGQPYPWLVRVNLSTFAWDDTVNLPFVWGFDIALTPDGAFGYVGESRSWNPGRIAKVALGPSMSLAETITSNPGSHALAVNPAGTYVYSADYNDHNQRTVSKIAIGASVSPPAVTGLSVTAGPLTGGGTTVISGTNLAGATGVSFGGTAATILSGTDDTIAVTVPPVGSAGARNVSVTTASGTSTQNVPYDYIAAPTVTSLSPASGPTAGGTTVEIVGTDLSGATVAVDGNAVATMANTPTRIEFTSPASAAGPAVVTVATTGGTVTAGTYTYESDVPPEAVAPSAPGRPVAIAGRASAAVTWTPPSSSGSFPVSTYEVRSVPPGGSCLTTSTSCTVSDLTSGTAYSFVVRALSGAGWGAWSLASEEVVPTSAGSSRITITGSREGRWLKVTGAVDGLEPGATLTPWPSRTSRAVLRGRPVSVSEEGTFAWLRRTGQGAAWRVFFTADDGTRSNTLILR